MCEKIYSFLTWNANGLRARTTDLHAYILLHQPDIIAIQEMGHEVFAFKGYCQYVLSCGDGSSRGLVTYIKSGLPVTLVEMGINGGIEYITVSLHLPNDSVNITNMYVHSGALYIDNFPSHILEECTILMGDLNSRHVDLGSIRTSNINGIRWLNFLEANDNVQITGDNVPTHIQGGRLDYVTLFNMPYCKCETNIVPCLLSDHFAIKSCIPLSSSDFAPRKRLSIPAAKLPGLLINVKKWYSTFLYVAQDANDIYKGLLGVINDYVAANKTKQRHTHKQRTYAHDPIILSCQDTLAALQRKWQTQPNNHEVKVAMGTVARHLSELKKGYRKEYWDKFLNKIRGTKSIQEIWYHVNRVRGKKTAITSDSHPTQKVQDLIQQWSGASALSSLPHGHRIALAENRLYRLQLVNSTVKVFDDTCAPITLDELLYAIKSGKSTAPGEDGLTYGIINYLVNIKGHNPVLDMFNMSFRNGRLPTEWKTAIIIPLPKSDGNYRPISLTSCLCKMMERIVLRRLLYKLGDKFSSNLYGFRKGRATSDCFVHCLANASSTCQAYVDLKGAFDKANKEVILEELVLKGVKGRLLGWIQDYLCARKGKVWLHGALSKEKEFELGTPQGGVLSPVLFNVLMDRIARHNFAHGTKIIIYADDILVQCDTPKALSEAVNDLEGLCTTMGLVINETKTKFQAKQKKCLKPIVNGAKIERVLTYKYLGVILGNRNANACIDHVRNMCLNRLNPLKVLAKKGAGVGVPVLRMFYIYVIRSLIDYAAPVLVQYNTQQLRCLEVIQNKAMRVILGCATTAKIEVLRRELGFPSIIRRIEEITCRTICRMVSHGAISLQRNILDTSVKNPYLGKICKVLGNFDVMEEFRTLIKTDCYTIWSPYAVNIDIEKLCPPKAQWCEHVLKAHFLQKMSIYPRRQVIHVYCDGSVEGSKTGCGVVIRDYSLTNEYTEYTISKRLPDNLSSTRAELYAILEGLHVVSGMGKNVYFFIDSQSALYELVSSSPADCDIVNRCLTVIHSMQKINLQNYFIWIPSHIGLYCNEKVDSLARQAVREIHNVPDIECTYRYIKSIVRATVTTSIDDDLNLCCEMGSASSRHFKTIFNNTDYVYGRHSFAVDLITMRLRLGYKYYWEVCSGAECEPCALCARPGGHTLEHYVQYCPAINEYRPQGHWNITELICHFIQKDVLANIIKNYPMFAYRW